MTKISKLTPLWGHSGSTGSFLYYSEDLDLYMAGSLNNVGSNIKPFILMSHIMKIFSSK
jgi:D-alanyl-D-alanine carboxypeptidase